MLTIRCLGGLEARRGDALIDGFESRKVRALLAYLACQRQRAFSREHLATLLWPEKDERAARRNLRQALYNLRLLLTPDAQDELSVFAYGSGIRLRQDASIWVDVEAFDEMIHHGRPPGRVSPHELASAVRLYRGDLLSDLTLRESSDFEVWLDGERERLREGMIGALRMLIESYMKRGEFRLGLQYAQRLVAFDSLSEEAHRYLIRLFALSGRRRRALDQYQSLERLLDEELGVEPLEETRQLYRSILADRILPALSNDEREPIGPLVPLVGRTRAFGSVTRDWQAMVRGQARMMVVEGEVGMGKTRLVRSFLDAATGQRDAAILMGRCFEAIPTCYQPFPKALRGVLDDELVASSPPATVRRLIPLVPELAELRAAPELRNPTLGPEAFFEAVVDLLRALGRPSQSGRARSASERPVILFLDDLHFATDDSYEILAHIAERMADQPLWIVATATVQADVGGRLEAASRGLGNQPPPITRVELGTLDRSAIDEIAAWLVGADRAKPLATLLETHSGGLPFHIAELINFLWDQDLLTAAEAGRWQLTVTEGGEPSGLGVLELMLERRLARLPFSTRRLAALAAVIGIEFEPELIRRTADEHPAVVEVGLEVMLERWILRQNSDRWTSSRRQRDIVLWSQGARQGSFEFAHRQTREVIYGSVSPARRQLIHLQVARALEALHADDPSAVAEMLAFHFTCAEDFARARRYATLAAVKASMVGARPVAAHYRRLAEACGDGATAEVGSRPSGGVMRDSGMFVMP